MKDTQPQPKPSALLPRYTAILLLFFGGLFAALWARRPHPSPADTTNAKTGLHLQGTSMGTSWHATIVDATDTARLQDTIQQALDAVDQRMSTWKPDSELSALGVSTSTRPQPISEPLLTVLEIATSVSAKTGGAYDVTIAPVVDAWGFGPDAPANTPDQGTLARLLQAVGPNMLVLDRAAGTVTKARPDVRIDLSSVAKGYGVDQALSAIAALGYSDLMVEVGGEVKAMGHNPQGEAWRVGVERPDGSGAVYQAIDIINGAMATSGDYRHYRQIDGVRVSHTIDARTGHPITHHLASVSVLHPSCAWADAWATALDVLGPDDGLALAESQGIPALFIVRTEDGFKVRQSTAWPQPTQAQPISTDTP